MFEIQNLDQFEKKLKRKQTFHYIVNDKKVTLYRIKFTIKLKDPFLWTESLKIYPKVLWKSTSRKKVIIALDAILNYGAPPHLFSHDKRQGPRFFGGIPFLESLLSKSKYSVWSSFSDHRFFLPEFEIHSSKNHQGILYVNMTNQTDLESLKKRLFSLTTTINLSEIEVANPVKRIDIPAFGAWCDTIEKSLYSFETTSLEKVVLARASYISYPQTLHPFSLVKKLDSYSKNATLFAFAPNQEGTFIGVSPETFYNREGQVICTEAVAGTCKKGESQKENAFLKKRLKNSEKEKREFNYVFDFLQDKLSILCESFDNQSEIKIKETATLLHLNNKLKGLLKKNICDADIIKHLHPTPAMGGNPQPLAIEFLDQTEPFVRGNYAAPIGWISPKSAELIVAIRSAFIKNNCMTVFAGAGIVKGSNALKEWEELELKIAHFMKIGSLCKSA